MHERARIFGPGLMVASMGLYVANDALVKFLGTMGAALPLGQIVLWRGLFMLALLTGLIVLLPGHGPRALRWVFHRRVMARSAWDTLVTFAYLTALLHMPLANILAIMNLAPLVILLLAAWRLGERLRMADMLLVAAGLVGALIVVRPGPDGFNMWALLALAAMLASAMRDISTRYIPANAPSLTVVLSNMLLVQLGGLILLVVQPWQMPQGGQWGLLALAAVLLVGGVLALVMAVRIAPLKDTAPWRYAIIVWGVLAGWLVFGEHPDVLTLAGIGIILLSSLLATLRQSRKPLKDMQ